MSLRVCVCATGNVNQTGALCIWMIRVGKRRFRGVGLTLFLIGLSRREAEKKVSPLRNVQLNLGESR